MSVLADRGLTRREVLIGGTALAAAATAGAAGASTADLGVFAERHLTIFRDYGRRAFSMRTEPVRDRLGAPDVIARVLWVSDLAPSAFAHRRDVVLVRPGVLELLPPSAVAGLIAAGGPVVLSGSAIDPAREDRPELWRHLAELMAMPQTPVEAFLDLRGWGSDDGTVLAGVDLFRRTYAGHAADWIAVNCPQGPRLPIG